MTEIKCVTFALGNFPVSKNEGSENIGAIVDINAEPPAALRFILFD